MLRNRPVSSRQNILPTLSPLGFLLPTRRSIILGMRSSPSSAFRLPRLVANINSALSHAAAAGICGLSRESSTVPTSALNPNIFSIYRQNLLVILSLPSYSFPRLPFFSLLSSSFFFNSRSIQVSETTSMCPSTSRYVLTHARTCSSKCCGT